MGDIGEFRQALTAQLHELTGKKDIPTDINLLGVKVRVSSGEVFEILMWIKDKFNVTLQDYVHLIEEYSIDGMCSAYSSYLNKKQII